MSVRNILMAAAGNGTPPGQVAFTAPGIYSWTVPAGVTSVCVVCIGGGGGGGRGGNGVAASGIDGGNGGGGGALSYANNIVVTPGTDLSVVVGQAGYNSGPDDEPIVVHGGASQFSGYVAYGGATGGSVTGTGGTGNAGNGGEGGAGDYMNGGGGGSAGGYSGNGAGGSPGVNGTGSGILGQGSSGPYGAGGRGSLSGGGVGYSQSVGNSGAVRIIWGAGRSFPSTNTGDM